MIALVLFLNLPVLAKFYGLTTSFLAFGPYHYQLSWTLTFKVILVLQFGPKHGIEIQLHSNHITICIAINH